jgi:hypothetical protein
MTPDDDHIAALRRIAFGRTHSAEDETRAEAARHELEAALAPQSLAADSPIAPTPPPVAETPPPPAVETDEPRRRRWPAWLVPAAAALVVGVVLGAGGALLGAPGRLAPVVPVTVPTSTFAAGSSGLPPTVVPLSADQPVTGSPGDVAAALLWFDSQQTDEDTADSWIMDVNDYDIVEASTRLVYSSNGSKVWIAQSAQGELCLLSTSGSSGALMCMTPEEFQGTGIPLHVEGSLSVVWNGQRLLVSTSVNQVKDVRP